MTSDEVKGPGIYRLGHLSLCPGSCYHIKDIHQLRDVDEAGSMEQNCFSVISMNDIPFFPVNGRSARTQYPQYNLELEALVSLADIEITKGVPQKRSFDIFENPVSTTSGRSFQQ